VDGRWLHTAGVAALAALALAWLASALPPDAFFSGDSGVKLIATLDALDHPARPFETDLPRVGSRATTLTDPMLVPHGAHAHVLQSPLFPPLTAPLVAAFGLRGAFVWPALAFVALVPLFAAARRQLVPETSWPLLAFVVVAANPLVFYALEFWEHAPAVALLTGGVVLIAPALRGTGSLARTACGGALVGAGVLLRPEGAWLAAGLALALASRPAGPKPRPALPPWLAFGAGAAALLLPAAALNYVHFGNPLGAHASAVLSPIGTNFLAARWQRVEDWLWPASLAEAAGVLLVAAAWIAGLFKADTRVRQVAALAGTALVAVLAARRALPEQAFWQGFPLALMAFAPTVARTREARRLTLAGMVAMAGVVLTATNDGGAQWGARFLLVAVPPLLLLAARGLSDAMGAGPWRQPRLALVALILLAGAVTSRSAYLELRGTKRNYQSLVAATQSFTQPGDLVLTNLWWLDQVAAALHGTRVFLYAPDSTAAARALATIRDERLDAVTLAWSADPAESPFPLAAALDGTCFRATATREIELRSVRFTTARCKGE
jgi:hypothetical protein